MSKLSCIGIRASGEVLDEMYLALANASRQPALRSSRTRHLLWKDGAGGAIAFHVARDGIQCATPFFEAPEPTVWNVSTFGIAADEACDHCSGADCAVLDDEAETRAIVAVQWLHFAPYESFLRKAQLFDLEVVGFVSSLRTYGDRSALRAAEPCPAVGDDYGGELFFATGASAGAPRLKDRARALIGGELEVVDHRGSALTNEPFAYARLRTSIGLLNVVVNPDNVEGSLAAGRWAWCDAWLVGRPTEPPPKTGVVGWFLT